MVQTIHYLNGSTLMKRYQYVTLMLTVLRLKNITFLQVYSRNPIQSLSYLTFLLLSFQYVSQAPLPFYLQTTSNLLRVNKSTDDVIKLQQELCRLLLWYEAKMLEINCDKFLSIKISRSVIILQVINTIIKENVYGSVYRHQTNIYAY